MSDKVVNLDATREKAKHRKKEAHLSSLQQRFEKALPTEEIDPKKKLLDIFKRK